jgi:heme O synthase-like polyprenyltransferase
LALALGFLAEWQFAPFIKDGSFGYFVLHLHQLKPITLLMIAAGGFIGFWVPFSRRRLE